MNSPPFPNPAVPARPRVGSVVSCTTPFAAEIKFVSEQIKFVSDVIKIVLVTLEMRINVRKLPVIARQKGVELNAFSLEGIPYGYTPILVSLPHSVND